MENGSKALLMAAEVLIGVMIISIGVYIFSHWSESSKNTAEQLLDSQIAEFNNQFLKYYGERIDENGNKKPIKCTIHDVVSIANLAQKNNSFYEVTNESKYSRDSLYIQIDFKSNSQTANNLEKKEQSFLLDLIKTEDLLTNADGTKEIRYFKVLDNYVISDMTKKIIYMKFVELKPTEI